MARKSALRKPILIVLLFAVCYVADWSGDLYSYNLAAQWRAFANANGKPQTLAGGRFDESFALLAASTLSNGLGKKISATSQGSQSAIGTVFGTAIGEANPSFDSDAAENSTNGLGMQSSPGAGLRGRPGVGISGGANAGSFGSSFDMSVHGFSQQ